MVVRKFTVLLEPAEEAGISKKALSLLLLQGNRTALEKQE